MKRKERTREEKKWVRLCGVVCFMKCPSAMIVGADGACNGCTLHGNKLGSGWCIANRVRTFPQSGSQDKRWGAEGRWAQRYLKNRKKSNAYFGKSLVRLACNQEKNKEKSDRKNEKKKEINRKKKQLKVQTEELNSHYQMAHIIIWHVAAAEREKACTLCRGDKKLWNKKRQKSTMSDLTREERMRR